MSMSIPAYRQIKRLPGWLAWTDYTMLAELVGYQNEQPIGALNFALGDANSAAHGLTALFAALIRRQATGRGCYIDLSQTEALLATLGHFVVAAQTGDAQPQPRGNAHEAAAPYGIFPTAETDGWISLAVGTDAQWNALLASAAPADWVRERALDTAAGACARTRSTTPSPFAQISAA